MTPTPRTRRNRLLAAIAVAGCFALPACGGTSAPSAVCSTDLAAGTPCVPAEDSFVHEAFEGRTTSEQTIDLMDDIRFRSSLTCANKPEDSVMCAMNLDGATMVYALDMPDNRKVQFSGGTMAEPVTLELSEGVPVGVRYEGPSMRVSVMTQQDNVDVEYYSLNTVEFIVPEAPVFDDDAADGGETEEGE